jgi:hypothetical protein
MYIHEAIRQEKKVNRGIARKTWSGAFYLIPTSGPDGFICAGYQHRLTPRWEPNSEDLTANDWYVVGSQSFYEKLYSRLHAVLETILHSRNRNVVIKS